MLGHMSVSHPFALVFLGIVSIIALNQVQAVTKDERTNERLTLLVICASESLRLDLANVSFQLFLTYINAMTSCKHFFKEDFEGQDFEPPADKALGSNSKLAT